MPLAAVTSGLLLFASALLTGSYEAVARISRSNLRTLEEEGFAGAVALAQLREDRDAARMTVLLFTTVFDLSALGIVALTGVATWGTTGPVTSTVVGVIVVLVAGSIVPNVIATRRPVRIALRTAPVLLQVVRLVRPITAPVTSMEEREGEEPLRSGQRELLEIQEIGEEAGVLEEAENRLVERAFRLDDRTAWDVMVPRVDVFSWKEDLTLEEIVAELADVPYSRVPVYRESIDDVTGIVYVREIYERFARGDRSVRLGALAREPFFVPGSLSLTQLLQDFQARRIHMGIVADEFGGTDGLVTMEDILEELVGEIRDETDVEDDEIVHISDDVLECDASVDVRDLDEALGIALPKVEHRSLNGFILEELGHVPQGGTSLEAAGVRIDILEASETQVLRARLTKLEQGTPAE